MICISLSIGLKVCWKKFEQKFKLGKKFLNFEEINFIENEYFIEKEKEFIQCLLDLENMIEDNKELSKNSEELDKDQTEVIMIIFNFK